jgi:ATP-binding cassette, subfamily B, bacterial PglK
MHFIKLKDQIIKLKNSQLFILWRHLSKIRRKQFKLLLPLMLLSSLAEVISIGLILPFLSVITSPELAYQHTLMQPFNSLLGITKSDQLVLPLTIFFISAVILSSSVRLLLLYVITRLSNAVGSDISIDIYRKTLYQEYAIHIKRNSSEVISTIVGKTALAAIAISSNVTIISSVIMLLGILFLLFSIDIKIALITIIVFGSLYLVIFFYNKRKLRENSGIIAVQSTNRIKSLQEGLGGVRDILIDSSQEFYCNIYSRADIVLRRASANNIFLGSSPKYVIESIGIALIAILAYKMTKNSSNIDNIIPILGVMVLGAQRLLPILQQIYSSYSKIISSKSSINDVLILLDQPLPLSLDRNLNPIKFNKEIQLTDVSFSYTSKSIIPVLKNIDLKIDKGSCIGFIGETGSGKSTLVDIIMGLLLPKNGVFSVDGVPITNKNKRAWQQCIAHVPQTIYLSDGTIEENIAFGILKDEVCHKRVEEAVKEAQLLNFIKGLEDGCGTIVGERGVRLSGGQRQRIGIARALYKKSDVLIFDEATSALDNDTELAVMKAMKEMKKGLTILIIAHRLTTLKDCDRVIKIDKGVIIFDGKYEDII